MSKEALHILMNVSKLLDIGTFPGKVAYEVLEGRQFIENLIEQAQAATKAETQEVADGQAQV